MSACTDASGTESSQVQAVRQPVRLTERTDIGGDVRAAAHAYMEERRAEMGLGEDDRFAPMSRRTGAGGFEHVRMQQTYRGVPVWGADVVVHAARGTVRAAVGNVVAGIRGLDASPRLAAAEAQAMAKADYARRVASVSPSVKAEELGYERTSTELIVFPHDKTMHLAWHVHFFTEAQAGVEPGRWHYFIDAHDGRLLKKANWLHTVEQATGKGGNPRIPRTWTAALDVEPTGQGNLYAMNTARMLTVNMNNQTGGQGNVVTGPLQNIGDEAINDAHGFAEVTLEMMKSWMGHNSIDDKGYVIRSRVHYDRNFENAFWDGTQMTYGDGASYFYALSGDIDVVSHEINHGFTEFHANLIYDGMSGGLNESFSDIAGVAAEFFHEGQGADFEVGKDIARNGRPLRFMCSPRDDGNSIDNAADFYPGIDVHFSSGVSNKAFCLATKRLSSGSPTGNATPDGVRRAAQAWYEANTNFWTSSTNFTQGCQGTIDAAVALGFSQAEREALRDSWRDVGVYCDGLVPPLMCDDIHTADTGVITSPNYPNPYPDNFRRTYCIDPAGGGTVNLRFTDFATESGYDFVEVSDGASGAQLANASGPTLPQPMSAPIIVIRFSSDPAITARGWRAEWNVTGQNQAPVASFTHTTSALTAAFTDASTDADGTITAWAWDFGDGTIASEQSPVHTFPTDGTYTVTLTVTDDDGATGTSSMDVTVTSPPPPDAPLPPPPDAPLPPPDPTPSEPDGGTCSCPDAGPSPCPNPPPTPAPVPYPGDEIGCRVSSSSPASSILGFALVLGAVLVSRRKQRR